MLDKFIPLSTKVFSFTSLKILRSGLIYFGLNNHSSFIRLRGAGATFPAKIYTRWFSDLAKEGRPKANYQAIGSYHGRKAFIDQAVDFRASDDPMTAKDIAKISRGYNE